MVRDYAIHSRRGSSYLVGMEHYGERQRKKYEFKEVYETDAGIFPPDEWKKRALEEIARERQGDLLDEIKDYCRKHCAWLHKETEVEEHAIECLASGAYQYWKDFHPQNGFFIFVFGDEKETVCEQTTREEG